ncbi:MAG: hypothetical protein ACYCSS_11455 [Sulfuriferula sp.]
MGMNHIKIFEPRHIRGIELSTIYRQFSARDLEKKSGKRIASQENYKQLPEAVVRKKVEKET